MQRAILWSGQRRCYDAAGRQTACEGSGQDAEFRPGLALPSPRFVVQDEDIVLDQLTGLLWLRNADFFDFPMQWQEAEARIQEMRAEEAFGRSDWRMPTRQELRSLVDHGASRPALPEGHPFTNIFLGWYWTSTDAAIAPGYAWRLQIEGGRMFFGNKAEESFLWPVAGESRITLQASTPKERFSQAQDGPGLVDGCTGLIWYPQASFSPRPLSWQDALDQVAALRQGSGLPWRMATINELESLVDLRRHSPALSSDHPFTGVQEGYWSSTTSFYEPSWSYVLYLHKGAVGVGFKANRDFYLWPVRQAAVVSAG
ncbi:MAG: DUF1566 domain-containing protein [bacterium]|nr:DUF1566 domain-containing protein [bacterium]